MTEIKSDAQPVAGSSKGRIAVDMDDVLCQTNLTIVDMHNNTFGVQPPLKLDDFENYLYWQNRGWGDPAETVSMVGKLYAQGLYMKAPPIPEAKDSLLRLKEMGYEQVNTGWIGSMLIASLIIITARSESQREGTEDWIAKYMPDIFDEIHFTGAFQHLEATPEEKEGHAAKRAYVSHTKRSKAEIVHSTKSLFLIDDSAENALHAANHSPPAKVLLFGDYPWNAVVQHDEGEPEDTMTYVQLKESGRLEKRAEKRKKLIAEGWLPEGVERVSNWGEVIEWVKKFEQAR